MTSVGVGYNLTEMYLVEIRCMSEVRSGMSLTLAVVDCDGGGLVAVVLDLGFFVVVAYRWIGWFGG